MTTLIGQQDLAHEFHTVAEHSSDVMIAVPFWGEGSIEVLGLERCQRCCVVCNLSSGACNPYVIERLQNIDAVTVRTNPRLHAKIYMSKDFAIIGSSNASANGLGIGEALTHWIEANVKSSDPSLVDAARRLFTEIWDSSETARITPAMLREAKVAWNHRPVIHTPTREAKTLLAACRETPDLFESMFVIPYEEDLGPGAWSKIESLKWPLREGFWCYQLKKKVDPETWFIDLNCMKKGKPKVGGCVQVTALEPAKVKGELSITFTKLAHFRVQGISLDLSPQEKQALIASAQGLLAIAKSRRTDLVPLAEAVRIIDRERNS